MIEGNINYIRVKEKIYNIELSYSQNVERCKNTRKKNSVAKHKIECESGTK
jgi:hypothetical protein